MRLVQKRMINKNHPYWSYLDQQAFGSKNLFNLANDRIRQHFFNTRTVLDFTSLYHLVSKTDAYVVEIVYEQERVASTTGDAMA